MPWTVKAIDRGRGGEEERAREQPERPRPQHLVRRRGRRAVVPRGGRRGRLPKRDCVQRHGHDGQDQREHDQRVTPAVAVDQRLRKRQEDEARQRASLWTCPRRLGRGSRTLHRSARGTRCREPPQCRPDSAWPAHRPRSRRRGWTPVRWRRSPAVPGASARTHKVETKVVDLRVARWYVVGVARIKGCCSEFIAAHARRSVVRRVLRAAGG